MFADSRMAAIIFKTKPAPSATFIQHHQILRKISVFVWRIGQQKRGPPDAHILFGAILRLNTFPPSKR
jgi:hypothetical protein